MSKIARARQRVGSTVGGRYRLVDVLGVGGSGAVYLAEHLVTEERVALKVLSRAFADSDPTAIERFVREARAAAQIKHPGVVKVFDAAEDSESGDLFLAMELLDGEELAATTARGDLTTEDLIALSADVLDILAAVHERGIVHRDIKPSNIYVLKAPGGGRTVKLIDFGVARQLDQSKAMTIEGSVLGTPWYMSPEQAAGKPVSVAADLWSVGAMLYHQIAGQPPFDGANAGVVISKILTEPAPSLAAARPDLPPALTSVVDRALRRVPEERWPDAATMARTLRAEIPSVRGVPLRPSAPSHTPSTQMRWATAKTPASGVPRRAVYGAAAVATALVALAFVASWSSEARRALTPSRAAAAALEQRALTAAAPSPSTPPPPAPAAIVSPDAGPREPRGVRAPSPRVGARSVAEATPAAGMARASGSHPPARSGTRGSPATARAPATTQAATANTGPRRALQWGEGE